MRKHKMIAAVCCTGLLSVTGAQTVICKIPADYKVPEYVTVASVKEAENGSVSGRGSAVLTVQVVEKRRGKVQRDNMGADAVIWERVYCSGFLR